MNETVDSLLMQMTLEEKIEQISGIGFDTNANERLNIPPLKMTDGPVGVRWGKATALPAAIALASSWDRELLFSIGELLGEETKIRGRNFFLGPCVNIHRLPIGGRNFESFGEDPYLVSEIAVPYIKGVQSRNVLACVKHFACNNQEWMRESLNAKVSERALHEIYFPAFKAAVQKAGVWAVMASYNKVNGSWTGENEYLLKTILKDRWGFVGFVVSDWDATHSTVKSFNAGLDLEMPFGTFFNVESIRKALKNGEISEEILNDKLRRLLRIRFKANLFKELPPPAEEILTGSKHKNIAYEAAVNSVVLLKNENKILPIDPDKVKKIALIGPNAAFARVGGGGSSKVTPFYTVSALEGLLKKVDETIEIKYAPGTSIKKDIRIIESSFFQNDHRSQGLQGSYFTNTECKGKALFIQNEEDINFLWYYDAPRMDMHGADDKNFFSVRWTGHIKAPESGEFTFHVMHNDGVRLWVNNKLLIDRWEDEKGSRIHSGKIDLQVGEQYGIQLDYYNNGGVSEIKLGWDIPNEDLVAEAVKLAEESDLVLAFIGLSDHFEGEGRDREFLVLENQDNLIQQISAVNPNTVAVIISGTPPIMEAWADRVPGIVQAWYGGQESGNAIADILLGNRNPSGKLPCTFYKSQNDSPGFSDYRNENLESDYSEGIYIGYRYMDKRKLIPRFPFGHGLSYTQFKYSSASCIIDRNNRVELQFKLTNTGARSGSEVVQIYVKPINTENERPEKELKNFSKIHLKPGETEEVRIILNESAFHYYDVNVEGWILDKGEYQLLIGSSSEQIEQTIDSLIIK